MRWLPAVAGVTETEVDVAACDVLMSASAVRLKSASVVLFVEALGLVDELVMV